MEAAQLTYSCSVCTVFLERCHLIRRATDLCVVVLFWGERPSRAPCCSRCCCNYSVVWGIFGLTFCIPFASQRDWNESKHYGFPCGKPIALDVYVLGFYRAGLDFCDHCWVAFAIVLCLHTFLCAFFQLCVIMQKMLWRLSVILTISAQLHVCLFYADCTLKSTMSI